jgi:spermidine synthase
MGYTLRAALDVLPPGGTVVVAEVLPAVVAWNRGMLAPLAGSPLSDPRVTLEEGDVIDLIHASPATFDAVLLDVDNGPSALTLAGNQRLYGRGGLAAVRRCLRPRGVLGVWSADPEPAFARSLRRVGFEVRVEHVFARGVPKGPRHTLFIAQRR